MLVLCSSFVTGCFLYRGRGRRRFSWHDELHVCPRSTKRAENLCAIPIVSGTYVRWSLSSFSAAQLFRNNAWNHLLNTCTIIHLILPMIEIQRCRPCMHLQKLPHSSDANSLFIGMDGACVCLFLRHLGPIAGAYAFPESSIHKKGHQKKQH